ncbi:hypothetical protein [Halalkalibacter akibai]|uniref:3'->5' exoribonuclease Bsu YhaM n=1 Tax=Halalkalibacter akibai (strain ATCC 43226 / DSM 21942 / CIP 109018 / JCM 9157 / 1139) TaxID=1236973 RepID=W4QPZ0_HALA3|nr:hypothetical protein [Halalkalibacter akibai]GAE34141.1 3'->5' exoribonuclease Bsu YhaM [Halalkalibacter akibai JCM 9157]
MNEWTEGETIVDFFLIRDREIKQASNGSEYANFTIQRNLHMMLARLWDITIEQKKQLVKKSIVKIEGTIITYRGQQQLNIKRIRLATEEDEVNVSELISREGVQREALWHELRLIMEEVHSPTLAEVIKTLYKRKPLRDRLTTIPASKNYHHPIMLGFWIILFILVNARCSCFLFILN